jgi:hypothetical protein
MLTVFSTPKPFAGHIDVIQRNAILSWRQLHPEIEIILVGDDEGAAEVCAELSIRHIAQVERNKYGTKYLASIYDRVQEVARHRVLCHVNCDILLMSDFLPAAEIVMQNQEQFLMAGRRWDVDVRSRLNFGAADWESQLRKLVKETGRQRPPQWIDYFLFPKELYYKKIPEFVIGRPGWDNWLLWYPLSQNVPVVDASGAVLAVHQNHDYGYHPAGEKGVWEGEEARENYRLHEGKFRTLRDATHVLNRRRLRPNYRRWLTLAKDRGVAGLYAGWFGVLNTTRPVRNALGLRRKSPTPGKISSE